MSLKIGQLLNKRYRIEKCIGRGGMGTVYRAWDTLKQRRCAVKMNDLDTSSKAQRQFQREAAILANLRHPNLPRVRDYFLIPNQGQYLVMDFVEGEDLQAALNRQGSLPETQVLAWIDQVCDALAYLHRQRPPIIHRDVKPANIKIRPDGGVMLVDFGIAKVYRTNLPTSTGAKAYSAGYSPPEQYGRGGTNASSDVYALGATLYALLTGQPPPDALNRLVRNIPLVRPRQLNPKISPAVEEAILKALDLVANRRFQSVDQFRSALTPPEATTAVPNPLRILLGIGLVAVMVIISILIFGQSSSPATTGSITAATIAVEPGESNKSNGRIAFESTRDGNPEIYIMNTDGSSQTRLTHNQAEDGEPAWSPDGSRLAFASNRAGNWDIYIMSTSGGDQTPLTSHTGDDSFPTWSPDGAQIAFSSDRNGNQEIYVMAADGTDQVRLTNHTANDSFPAWSPDGEWIAFASDRNGNWDIYLMPVTGGDPSRLTDNPGKDVLPAWAPDGNQLAFASDREGNFEIYVMLVPDETELLGNSIDTTQTRLTNNLALDWSPTWSPTGSQLAFHSNRDGNEEIYVVNISGTQEIAISQHLANDSFPAWSPK